MSEIDCSCPYTFTFNDSHLLLYLETAPVPTVRTTVQQTVVAEAILPTTAENGENGGKAVVVDEEKSAELIVVADNSTENTSNTNLTTVQSSNGNGTMDDKISEPVVEENLSELNIHQNGKDTVVTATSSVDESEAARQSSLSPGPGSFSRNSTLTRSQRKKVTPQVNIIKNMIMASNTYSPPVIDPSMSSPSFPLNHEGASAGASTQLNGDKSDVNENFIISSQAQKQQNEAAAHSEANDHHHIDHPLSISTSASHNSLSEFGLNGGSTHTHELSCAIIHPFSLLTTSIFKLTRFAYCFTNTNTFTINPTLTHHFLS